MFRIECMARMVLVALVCMPLLTELVSREKGVCYRHGAPNGAFLTSQCGISRKTAKTQTTRARHIVRAEKHICATCSFRHETKATLKPVA
jgi:hypothetical protein